MIIQVLEAQTPNSVQKRKREQRDNLPHAAVRFLPNSDEYKEILEEWAGRVNKKPKKESATSKEKKPTKK